MTESRDRKEKKLPVYARAVLPFPVQMKECRRMAKGYIKGGMKKLLLDR